MLKSYDIYYRDKHRLCVEELDKWFSKDFVVSFIVRNETGGHAAVHV